MTTTFGNNAVTTHTYGVEGRDDGDRSYIISE